jgi:hypothetical protein
MNVESDDGRAFVETSRAALAKAVHAASFSPTARTRETSATEDPVRWIW